jgi:hypothetical protein
MMRILPAGLFAILSVTAGAAQSNDFVTIVPEPAYYAWWLRAKFHPFETQVRGVPIGRIRATWCKASEFRKELFPPDLARDFEHGDGLAFSIDGHFDGSKVDQAALIGVYETCAGQRGSFLLVLARRPGKPPDIRFLHEFPELEFGILSALPDSTIDVFHCMECDHVTRFKWDKSRRRFVRIKPRDE